MIPSLTNPTNLRAPSPPAPAETEAALDLRRLERDARRLRQAFAGDPSVRLVVGLDLLIRRAAIRLRAAWRGLLPATAAAPDRGHASPTRS